MARSATTFRPQLDEERKAKYVDALTAGGSLRIAAGVARIPQTTAERWLQYGRRDLDEWAEACEELEPDESAPVQTVYAAFYVEVAEALAKRDLGWLEKIEQGGIFDDKGKPNWQNFAWLLERLKPDEFALRSDVKRLEITGAGGGPIQTEVRFSAVQEIFRAAGVEEIEDAEVVELEDGDDRPRRALPAPAEVLAEPSVGKPAAGGVPAPTP